MLAIAITAAAAARSGRFVRRRKQSPSPEMRALFGSKAGSPQILVQAYWVRRAAPRVTATWIRDVETWNQKRL